MYSLNIWRRCHCKWLKLDILNNKQKQNENYDHISTENEQEIFTNLDCSPLLLH